MNEIIQAAWMGLVVLAIGAHPDDIELGAGGFVYRLKTKLGARIHFLILTRGTRTRMNAAGFDPDRRRQESLEAARVLGVDPDEVTVLDFGDGRLRNDLVDLITAIEKATAGRKYDLVLTHAHGDTHQDHRAAYEASIAGTRTFDGTVLLYQAPSTIPNEFRPTLFVGLDDDELQVKQRAIEMHASQRGKNFTHEGRTRGMAQSWASFFNTPEKYFEAFEVYKSFWN